MARSRSALLIIAGSMAILVAASALAHDREHGPASVTAPTLPPSHPCPSIAVPGLGPDVGDMLTATLIPIASDPRSVIVAAPRVPPDACPSPVPLRGGEPIAPHPLGFGQAIPRIGAAGPVGSPAPRSGMP